MHCISINVIIIILILLLFATMWWWIKIIIRSRKSVPIFWATL